MKSYDITRNRLRARASRHGQTILATGCRDNLGFSQPTRVEVFQLQKFRGILSYFSYLTIVTTVVSTAALADGTRTWEQFRFDELTKGTATGVAIRSNSGLELAPTFKSLYATPSTYIWAIAADRSGVVYVAAGAPARVYRVTPDGKATIIFEPKELQVQALQIASNSVIYAATAPDGKVYKLEHKAGTKSSDQATKAPDAKDAKEEAGKPAVDSSWSSSIYFEPATKYIWDLALDNSGNLYVATGDHGEIFRITPKGERSVFFKSDETHIRVLAFDAKENLIAGSDGSGLIYRISPGGEGFVLYSAPKKEITALALDPAGNIYAAAVGEKKTSGGVFTNAPVLSMGPVMAMGTASQVPGLTITSGPAAGIALAGPFPFPGGNATGGSDIYRIAPDGSPARLWTSREDIVYALAFDSQGSLLAGTGNRGHVFAIHGMDDYSDLLKAAASQVTAFAQAPGGAIYAATSNLGKVFVLGPGPEPQGSYESDVYDAKIFSRWGRAEYRGTGDVELYARSGNVDNPDRNWSAWKKIDLHGAAETGIPDARYGQWKAVLRAAATAPSVDSVTLNFLPKNVAPEIDDVTVQAGVKYQSAPKNSGLSYTSDSSAGSSNSHFETPPSSTHDRDSIGVKWTAHDDNDDQLTYSIYFRGDGESRWLLLKDNLTDKAYSFDASLLPDGGYTIKVVASDAPSHSAGEALSASKESRRFEVDTTPPRIDKLSAVVDKESVHIAFQAVDRGSNIKRAEYSIDAGDWKYVEPVGQLSDAKSENYDFKAALEAPSAANATEHLVVVRVYDRDDNMGAAKIVVHPAK
jgi:sugar lactone lactonase YvrE